MSGKSEPGLFYQSNPENRFDVMITLMKRFVSGRQRHLLGLLNGYNPPPAPKLTGPKVVQSAGGRPKFAVSLPSSGATYRWRMAEVTDPKSKGIDPKKPWRYEIESLWESEQIGGPEIALPTTSLQAGHLYRVRLRSQGVDGRRSRWSAPVEFLAE